MANIAPYQLANRDKLLAKVTGLMAGLATLVAQTPSTAGPLAKIQAGLTTYSASRFASNKTQHDKKNFRRL
jgi:hypothetical protein